MCQQFIKLKCINYNWANIVHSHTTVFTTDIRYYKLNNISKPSNNIIFTSKELIWDWIQSNWNSLQEKKLKGCDHLQWKCTNVTKIEQIADIYWHMLCYIEVKILNSLKFVHI